MHAPRYLHTMLRVRDLQAMLGFYCGLLGMHELRRIEFAAQRYTLVFIGYGDGRDDPQLELWHDWGDSPPAAPAAGAATEAERHLGHLGFGVRDIEGCVRKLAARGVAVRRAPAPMRPGGRVIALLADPEGNEVELLASD
ncbi:MAG: VOC family protein [Steroidobacteraceae bacterium]